MSFFINKAYKKKPTGFLRPNLGLPFFDRCIGFWQLAANNDQVNQINYRKDGILAATSDLTPGDFGRYLHCDGVNSGFYRQTLRGTGNYYTAPTDFTDIALLRPHDFAEAPYVAGHQFGNFRNVSLNVGSNDAGRLQYIIDATVVNGTATTDRDDVVENWGWGIAAGGSIGSTAWILFHALPGQGTGKQLYDESSGWSGDTGGELYSVGHRPRTTYQENGTADILWAAHLSRAVSLREIDELVKNPFGFWDRRIWVPVDIGITPIGLSVENLAHTSPIDSVNVESSYILQIDGANHASRLDECAVTLSAAISLLIDGTAHGSILDEPLITPTYTLIPQPLAHAHALDESAVYWHIDLLANGLAHASRIDTVDVQAAPEIALDVDAITHVHAIDALVIGYEVALAVDGLRHGHPIDAPDVSALLGLLTTVRRNDTTWRINAGQSVDNAAGVDAGWHVIEAVFDGAGSLLSVDGAPVAGNAGVRELNSLTLGAELDGGERLTGDVGELRIYNGALTQTQRDKIRAELQGKWL